MERDAISPPVDQYAIPRRVSWGGYGPCRREPGCVKALAFPKENIRFSCWGHSRRGTRFGRAEKWAGRVDPPTFPGSGPPQGYLKVSKKKQRETVHQALTRRGLEPREFTVFASFFLSIVLFTSWWYFSISRQVARSIVFFVTS